MSKYVPETYLSLLLNEIKKADAISACTEQPTTYYQAVKGDIWTANTAYSVGDIMRNPTPTPFVYECIQAGTSASMEPAWGTAQDQEFTDNGCKWKTHINHCLVYTSLNESDKTIAHVDADGSNPSGMKLTIKQKLGIIAHKGGDVTHTALICNADKSIKLVTLAQTALGGSNTVEVGKTTIFFEFGIISSNPQ